jgi:vesicle-associated membrane protein 4
MGENINKVKGRGVQLDVLQDGTDSLSDAAALFRRGANQKRKEMWWKETKIKLCLFAFAVIVIIILIVVTVFEVKKSARA